MKKIANKSTKQFFFKHNHENIEEHKIVNRSSGIFYFINTSAISTELHYLNYWREKRSLSNVFLRLTFRSMQGDLLNTLEEKVENIGSHIKSIKSILNQLKISEKEGSVEMEFFSNDDMFISYPAVVIRYLGTNWHTSAHTSQRIFSKNSGDNKELLSGTLLSAEEGNIAISDLDSSPFFIIHNGPIELPSQNIVHEIIRSDGEIKSYTQKNIKFKPYETKIIKPLDLFEYSDFAKNKLVTFTIKFLTTGIFSRLIAGFEKDNCWSIDHTNFAANYGSSAKDVLKPNKEKNFKNLVFNFPINPEWNNSAIFPPSYPENRSYEITLNGIDINGKVILNSEIVCGRNKKEEFFPKFEFSKNELNFNPEFIISNRKEIPKRFHMVISYQKGIGLPGFIVDGPIPFTTKGIRTRWLPLFGGNCENYIIISNRILGSEKPEEVIFNINLFNSFNEKANYKEIKIKAFESRCIHISEICPDSQNFLKNKPGWLYLIADKEQRCNIHYASLLGDSIACDHAF